MRIETERNFIFIGNNKGILNFYDFDEKEGNKVIISKRMEIIMDRKYTTKICDIKYKQQKNELMCGLGNGSIAFYSHHSDSPEYVLDAHDKTISHFIYEETNKMLFTASADKTIKVLY